MIENKIAKANRLRRAKLNARKRFEKMERLNSPVMRVLRYAMLDEVEKYKKSQAIS